jgi:hypothetical protein
MPTTLDKILHHQRILVTGKRSAEIIDTCCKVLDHYKRAYDIATSKKTSISNGPLVLIEAPENLNDFDPHIALMDQVSSTEKDSYMKLADGISKSGTLVYNKLDKITDEICSIQRTDVHLEPFAMNSVNDAAMALLKRVGISEESFKKALN